MKSHTAGARRPLGAGSMSAQACEFVPCLPPIGCPEQGRVFDTGIDGIGVGQRRFKVPDTLELPWVLRTVVELVRGERFAGFGRRIVAKLVAFSDGRAVGVLRRLPGFESRLMPRLAAVVGALNDLSEPAAGL